jgi:hypothetical protein
MACALYDNWRSGQLSRERPLTASSRFYPVGCAGLLADSEPFGQQLAAAITIANTPIPILRAVSRHDFQMDDAASRRSCALLQALDKRATQST